VSEADELRRKTYYTGLSSKNSQDEFKYFHYNHRGDTVLVTDKNGEVVGKFDYEAYGNVIGSDGLNLDEVALKNLPNVFVGAYGIRYDTKTDLSYMRFRWYSPETMRFVSPDRLMGVNRYGYVAGNPMIFIDPMGEKVTQLPIDFPTDVPPHSSLSNSGITAYQHNKICQAFRKIHNSCPENNLYIIKYIDCSDYVREIKKRENFLLIESGATNINIYTYEHTPHHFAYVEFNYANGQTLIYFTESNRPNGSLYQTFLYYNSLAPSNIFEVILPRLSITQLYHL
jgi:RHS repeat-associated protein